MGKDGASKEVAPFVLKAMILGLRAIGLGYVQFAPMNDVVRKGHIDLPQKQRIKQNRKKRRKPRIRHA